MTTVFRCNLRLTDVHATAETVGGEFRKLTDRFGMECAAELLSPVVRALEWLEAYVESYQQLQTTVSELEMENDTLEYEREQRALMAAKNEVQCSRAECAVKKLMASLGRGACAGLDHKEIIVLHAY